MIQTKSWKTQLYTNYKVTLIFITLFILKLFKISGFLRYLVQLCEFKIN